MKLNKKKMAAPIVPPVKKGKIYIYILKVQELNYSYFNIF